jgi:hypothetical protein
LWVAACNRTAFPNRFRPSVLGKFISSLSVSEFGKSSWAPKNEFHMDDVSIPICIVGAGWMSAAI